MLTKPIARALCDDLKLLTRNSQDKATMTMEFKFLRVANLMRASWVSHGSAIYKHLLQ